MDIRIMLNSRERVIKGNNHGLALMLMNDENCMHW